MEYDEAEMMSCIEVLETGTKVSVAQGGAINDFTIVGELTIVDL